MAPMQWRGSQPAIHSSNRFVHVMTSSRKNTILGHRGKRIRNRGVSMPHLHLSHVAVSDARWGQLTIHRASHPTVRLPSPFGQDTLVKDLWRSVGLEKNSNYPQVNSTVSQEVLSGDVLLRCSTESFGGHNGGGLLLVARVRAALPGSHSDILPSSTESHNIYYLLLRNTEVKSLLTTPQPGAH